MERLDREIANSAWLELFGENRVEVLTTRVLDHPPLLVSTMNKSFRGLKEECVLF